ncbi:MAG: hypothetical protein ACK2UP_19695, partial [Candidatus Promineifilaceae bacterium]
MLPFHIHIVPYIGTTSTKNNGAVCEPPRFLVFNFQFLSFQLLPLAIVVIDGFHGRFRADELFHHDV